MSENKPGDDGERDQDRQAQIGLSVPREDAERRPPRGGWRRNVSAHAKLRQAVQVDKDLVESWFLPFAVLVLILLVIGTILYNFHASQLDALEAEVAALEKRAATSTPDGGLERIASRVQTLEAQANAVEDLSAEVQSLRSTVGEQSSRIDTLTKQLDKPGRSPTASGGGQTGSEDAVANDSSSTQEAGETGNGDWTINLITVADRASAETFQKRLDDLGVASRIESVTVEDKSLQRVVVPGFQSRQAAENAGAELKQRLELSDDPWITRQ